MVTAPAVTMTVLAKYLIGCMYFGWALASLGDLQKTFVKARDGADTLVNSGLYAYLRHPNYTGEMLMWTSSFAAAVVTAFATKSWAVAGPWLALAALGVAGINFVLLQATAGLEKKQLEKYGDDESYKKWVKTSWSGPSLKKKEAPAPPAKEEKKPKEESKAKDEKQDKKPKEENKAKQDQKPKEDKKE